MEDSGLWNKQEDWNAWKTVSVLGCDKKEYCRFFFFFVWLGGSGGRCIMCSILLVALVLCITCLQPWLMDARLPSLPTKAAFVCKRKESMNTTYTSVFWFVHSSQCTTVGIYLFFCPPSLSLINDLVRQVGLILWNTQHCIAFWTAMYKSVQALQENCYSLSDWIIADRFLSFCYLQ